MVAIQCSRVSDGSSSSLHLILRKHCTNAEGGDMMTVYETVMLVLTLVSIGLGVVGIMK